MFDRKFVTKRSFIISLSLVFFSCLNSPLTTAQVPVKKIPKVRTHRPQPYSRGETKTLEAASTEQLARQSRETQKKMWVSELVDKFIKINSLNKLNWTYLYGFGLHQYINAIDFLTITSKASFEKIITDLAEKLFHNDAQQFPNIESAQLYVLSAINSHHAQLRELGQNSPTSHPNWEALNEFQGALLLSMQFSLNNISFDTLVVSNTEDVLRQNWRTLGSTPELTSIVLQNSVGNLLAAIQQEAGTNITVPNLHSPDQQVNVAQLLAVTGITPQAMLQHLLVVSDGYYPVDNDHGYIQPEVTLLSTMAALLKKIWSKANDSLQKELAQMAIQVLHLNFLTPPTLLCTEGAAINPVTALIPAAAESEVDWEEFEAHIRTNSCQDGLLSPYDSWLKRQLNSLRMQLENMLIQAGILHSCSWIQSQNFISSDAMDGVVTPQMPDKEKAYWVAGRLISRWSSGIIPTEVRTFFEHFCRTPASSHAALTIALILLGKKTSQN